MRKMSYLYHEPIQNFPIDLSGKEVLKVKTYSNAWRALVMNLFYSKVFCQLTFRYVYTY